MRVEHRPIVETSLDPSDWNALRSLGHRMVDDMMTYLEQVRERPAWQPVPERVRQALRAPLPLEPAAPETVYEEFQRDVLPYPLGNIHPRFWGWVIGTGTPLGALSEMLAATMNPNVGGAEQVANYVELQVLDWCKEMLGYPPGASGLLVSGGSMANLVGLTVARNAKAEVDVSQAGLQSAPRRMVFYASSETHNSVRKSAGLLGLGRDALREIAVDGEYRIDLAALARAIADDRRDGHLPFCVIGNAGTVNTGAIDDLSALGDLCREHDLWFHVDGAFGALAAISESLRPLVAGMERADSLAFDLHKWMYMPYEAGCALVRHPERHREAFTVPASYLVHAERGTAAGQPWFSDYGVQLSRAFRALKVWMSLKEHGVRKYATLIEQNVEQARYLMKRVQETPELELMAPVPLNIVCFRYVAPGLAEAALDRLNEDLLVELQEQGIAVPTSTRLGGRFAIRVANVNHRSRREDFDLLLREVLERGARLSKDLR
jgi:glutamate/tyrosine decarboxylase-like PLP-dependent enzyme